MICQFSCRDCIGPLNAIVCGRDLLFATGAKKMTASLYVILLQHVNLKI